MNENIVLDRVTSENKSECCDFVACNNCGRAMLINHGENTCPECECNIIEMTDTSIKISDIEIDRCHEDGEMIIDLENIESNSCNYVYYD